MIIDLRERNGSILITLIVSITVLSVLTAAILSYSTINSNHAVNARNMGRAFHLADAGLRYSKLVDLPEDSYLTFVQDQSGNFQIFKDNPSPSVPKTISTSGFRIAYGDCRIESTGIVGEGSLFEVSRTLGVAASAALPCCWRFNEHPDVLSRFKDDCGGSTAVLKGASWTDEGKIGGGLEFEAGDYVETDFKPFCGIGNGVSFTISFWAKPSSGSDGIVLGVSDGESRLSVGITGNRWMWAFGDLEGVGKTVDFGQWQFVSVSYDAFLKILKIAVDDCSPELMPDEVLFEYSGSGAFPESVKRLFIGAENRNGSPHAFYQGLLDEIEMVQGVRTFEKQFCIENHSVVYYPFNGDADDESLNGGTYDGEVDGAKKDDDRFGLPEKAYLFDGNDDIIRINNGESPVHIIEEYPFSLSAWIQANPIGESDGTVIGISDGVSAAIHYGIYISSAEAGRVCLQAGDEASDPLCSDMPVDDGQWHFVAGTFRNENDIAFFVDGREVTADVPPKTVPFSNITRVAIGNWGNPANSPFDGKIDEVAICHELLTLATLTELSQQRPTE